MENPVLIDGTTLEGGGQLVRIALGLSTLTEIPISFTRIRGRRHRGGGLKGQHLTCVQWLAKACNARVIDAAIGSRSLTFTPQQIQSHLDLQISQSSPGSIGLVFQAVLPFLLFSGQRETMELTITGGTNVSNSLSVDYVSQVLAPMLEVIGIPRIKVRCLQRGWSSGGTQMGTVQFTITPLPRGVPLPSFKLTDRGAISDIEATVVAPKSYRDIFEAMLPDATAKVVPGLPLKFSRYEESYNDSRVYLLIVVTSTKGYRLGCDHLSEKKIARGQADATITDVVKKVLQELEATIAHEGSVDEYLRDQLVVFQACAEGRSRVDGGRQLTGPAKPSLHTQTAYWVAERILGVKFDASGACEGVGLVPGEGYVKGGVSDTAED